jgi:hypothetical protein
MPDLEDLRRLRSDQTEAKATLGEAMRGPTTYMATLPDFPDELNLEPGTGR